MKKICREQFIGVKRVEFVYDTVENTVENTVIQYYQKCAKYKYSTCINILIHHFFPVTSFVVVSVVEEILTDRYDLEQPWKLQSTKNIFGSYSDLRGNINNYGEIWFFMPPYQKIRGILFYLCPSVHLSVCPTVCLHKLNMKTEYFPITPKLI